MLSETDPSADQLTRVSYDFQLPHALRVRLETVQIVPATMSRQFMTSGAIRMIGDVSSNLILYTIARLRARENSSLVKFTLESGFALNVLSVKREILSRN